MVGESEENLLPRDSLEVEVEVLLAELLEELLEELPEELLEDEESLEELDGVVLLRSKVPFAAAVKVSLTLELPAMTLMLCQLPL